MEQKNKKIKIAFFGDDFSRRWKGTAHVIQKIVEELLNNHHEEVEIVLLRPYGSYKNPIGERVLNIEIPRYFSTTLSYLWFFMTHREQYDVVIFNRVVYPGFWFLRAKKYVLFLHDASKSSVYTVPTTFANSIFEYFLRCVGKYFLDAIIAGSQDAQRWIVESYRIPYKKVHVLYYAVSDDFKSFSAEECLRWKVVLKEKYNIKSPYILNVSRMDPHKNIDRVIDSYCLLKERHKISHSLVLVGGKHTADYSRFIENKISSSSFRDDILIADYIIPEDMPALYNCAEMLVFPSLVEGFGMPIIEAMKCGVPVITSNISSMPEIAGEAAFLVDPIPVEAIAHGIITVMNNSELKNHLIEKGLKRAQDFSWSKSAKTFIDIIQSP